MVKIWRRHVRGLGGWFKMSPLNDSKSAIVASAVCNLLLGKNLIEMKPFSVTIHSGHDFFFSTLRVWICWPMGNCRHATVTTVFLSQKCEWATRVSFSLIHEKISVCVFRLAKKKLHGQLALGEISNWNISHKLILQSQF